MGLCNIYNYSINKTIKLSDSYKVYIKLSNEDYKKIGMSAPPDGNLMELFECTNVEFPYYKFTEETVSWGNNKEAVYIPDYESMDDLKITLLEHYSYYENYKNKNDQNTYNNLLKIGQLVDLFLNKLFDMKTFTYKIDTDFIPELDIYIASNDFNYYVAKYNFTNLKLSDYSSYDLDYSSSSPTKWELSFAFEGYSITYYTDYKDPFESTNAAKPEKPAPAKPKDPAAPVVQPAQPQDAKPSEGAAPADAPKRKSTIKSLPPLSATSPGLQELSEAAKAASETAKKALDGIGGLVPEGTFDEMGSSKDDPRKSMTGFDGFSVTADNHIDGITSPTPERIEGELKGVENITGENLMNDMEAKAVAKHNAELAAAAEAGEVDEATSEKIVSITAEWNAETINNIPDVLGPLEKPPIDEPVGPVVPDIPPAELAPSFGVNAIVPEGTFGELGERGDPRKNMTGFDDFAITADNHIDGLASPTPQRIATTLKGNAITYETLIDDMESAAVAKRYEEKAIAAAADADTRAAAASVADEWNDYAISNIPDVLGPLEKPPIDEDDDSKPKPKADAPVPAPAAATAAVIAETNGPINYNSKKTYIVEDKKLTIGQNVTDVLTEQGLNDFNNLVNKFKNTNAGKSFNINSGKYEVFDIGNMRTYMVTDGKVTDVINTFVADGEASQKNSESPEGIYRVENFNGSDGKHGRRNKKMLDSIQHQKHVDRNQALNFLLNLENIDDPFASATDIFRKNGITAPNDSVAQFGLSSKATPIVSNNGRIVGDSITAKSNITRGSMNQHGVFGIGSGGSTDPLLRDSLQKLAAAEASGDEAAWVRESNKLRKTLKQKDATIGCEVTLPVELLRLRQFRGNDKIYSFRVNGTSRANGNR